MKLIYLLVFATVSMQAQVNLALGTPASIVLTNATGLPPSAIASGTNSASTIVCGTGCSIAVSGSGTISATGVYAGTYIATTIGRLAYSDNGATATATLTEVLNSGNAIYKVANDVGGNVIMAMYGSTFGVASLAGNGLIGATTNTIINASSNGASGGTGFIQLRPGGYDTGATAIQFKQAEIQLVSGVPFCWSSGAIGSCDTGISRDAAGIIDFGTGAAASVAGSFKATASGTIAVLTANLKTCSAGGATPTGINSYSGAVSDSVAPALGVALTGGGTVWAHVHCSLTTGTYLVDGI